MVKIFSRVNSSPLIPLFELFPPIEPGPELDQVDRKTDDADGTDWVLVELLSKVKLDEEKIAGKRKLED